VPDIKIHRPTTSARRLYLYVRQSTLRQVAENGERHAEAVCAA